MNLSTIIVTWNSQEHIGRCIETLVNHCPIPNQIVVVDNGSTDGTVDEINKWIFSVTPIFNKKNYGLGYATQQAYSITKGDYILVINPDIFTTGIQILLHYAITNPQYDALYPNLIAIKGGGYEKAIHWHRYPHYTAFSFGTLINKLAWNFLMKYCINVKQEMGSVHSENTIDDIHVYGLSAILLKRSFIERAGGIYNPKYRWAWADADLGMRMAKYGCNGKGVPEANVLHYGSYSSKKLTTAQVQFLAAYGQKTFEKEWGHSTRYFVAQFLDTIFAIVIHRRMILHKIFYLKGWVS